MQTERQFNLVKSLQESMAGLNRKEAKRFRELLAARLPVFLADIAKEARAASQTPADMARNR